LYKSNKLLSVFLCDHAIARNISFRYNYTNIIHERLSL